jgi:alpha-tubulin suppressor-like RCC1 family protein
MRRALVLMLVIACGDQELAPLPCSIACDAGCPDGTTCSVGFCAATGETCAPDLQQLSAGAGFACGLDQVRRAWCWGGNEDRQIEDSPRETFTLATVAGERRWDEISAGAGHVCAIDEGELWCWGRNDRNQVTSAIVGDVPAPVRIEVDGATVEWTAVAAGVDYTCGIADRRLLCWGAGTSGKLGHGSPDDMARPTQVRSDIADWIAVDTGLRHTCAISESLGVWCWGDGSSGQLGNGQESLTAEPVAAGLIGATQVAVGLDSTCAIDGGELFCWGRASRGALGEIDPGGGNQLTAVKASELAGWVELASGETHACGRREDGSVYCWGTARAGGLGGGLWEHRGFVKVMDNATALTVGWNGTDADPGRDDGTLDLGCATQGGRVHCWGDNRVGQLAQGGFTRSATPIDVGGDHAWSAITAGASHVCGIDDANRAVYCWGSIERGQVAGVEAGVTTPCTAGSCDAALPARVLDHVDDGGELVSGANHTCARSGTQVTCWGESRAGQAGATIDALVPTIVPGAWSRVFAGANGSCGIDDTAQVTCWGGLVADALPASAALAGAASIGLGFEVGCLLDATGELACFGDATVFGNGDPGTCGDGSCNNDETADSCAADCGSAPVSQLGRSYTAIAVGRRPYACGITAAGGVECWGDNARGQIGTVELSFASTPHPIANPAGCTQVSAGRDHACAVCAAGITCWGEARHGELGGDLTLIPEFAGRTTPPPDGETWTSVTVGDGFTCGTTSTKRALCWGTSLHGALGTGARGSNLPLPIKLLGE